MSSFKMTNSDNLQINFSIANVNYLYYSYSKSEKFMSEHCYLNLYLSFFSYWKIDFIDMLFLI